MTEHLTLGDICVSHLNRYPHWYSRFGNSEKVIIFNMLRADAKYFDIAEKIVKSIPEDKYVYLDEDYDPILA